MSEKPLNLSQLEAIDAIVDRFEDEWESGSPPNIIEFLDELNESDNDARRALLVELVSIDIEQRWRLPAKNDAPSTEPTRADGSVALPETPLAEDYAKVFPELCGADTLIAQMVEAEYKARGKWSKTPTLEEYQRRFPEMSDTLVPMIRKAAAASSSRPNATGKEILSKTPGTQDDAGCRPSHIDEFGDYRIEAEIASGGMGVVYRAHHKKLNRSVALKMIKSGELASDQEVKRFRTEAQSAAILHHPNIVSIYEVGELDGQHYYAMNFVDGQSLSESVQEGPLPQKVAADICGKSALAVAHAHAQGIVHRDLKPGNILLDTDGEPRITDFGLAKKVEGESDLTMTGQILGTPRFMSPEQAEGRPDVGPLADVYALGAILYYCLTGRAPFQAATVVDTLMQVREQEPVSPRALNPEVDRDLETICLKCLQKDPAKRYESALAFAEDLRRWQHQEPILARPISSVERFIKWVRRRPAAAAAVLACIVAMFALGALISAASYNDELSEALGNSQQAEAATQRALHDLSVQQGMTAEALEAANAANEEVRRLSYYRKVALATEEWDRGNAREASELITEAQGDDVGWEWHYVHRQYVTNIDSRRFRMFRSVDPDVSLALTSDSEIIVALATIGLYSYDLLQRQRVAAMWNDPEPTRKRVSRDLAFVAGYVGHLPDQPIVRIWRFQSGELVKTIDFAKEIGPSFTASDVTFTSDPDVIVVRLQNFDSKETRLVWWNWQTGKAQREFGFSGVQPFEYGLKNTMCLSADDALIAVANSPHEILLLDAERGTEKWKASATTAEQSSYAKIRKLEFNDDGTRLATVRYERVAIWDAPSGQLLHELNHPDVVHGIVMDPNGYWIATGGVDRIVRVWDLKTGELLTAFRGHSVPVIEIQRSPDGAELFSLDMEGHVLRWDLGELHQEFQEYSLPFAIEKVVFSGQDSGVYASGTSGSRPGEHAALVRFKEGNVSKIQFGSAFGRSLCVSPDGLTLVTSAWGRQIQLRDPQTGEVVGEFGDARPGLMNLEMASDGSTVLAGYYQAGKSPGGRVAVWDLESQMLRFERQFEGNVWDVAVHPDGTALMATVGPDSPNSGFVVLDSESGEQLFDTKLDKHGRSLAIAPSGDRYAIAKVNRTIEIRSYPDHEIVHMLNPEEVFAIDVAFTPDGKRLAAVTGGGVTIFDAVHGIRAIKLNHPLCRCLDFSKDGSYLVTGSADGKLRIWDASR